MQKRFFDLITPVFDGALPSLEKLALEMKAQTFTDWNWILCSNGESKRVHDFVNQENDPRIILLEFPQQQTDTTEKLMRNICGRRNLSLQQAASDYIIMLDADIKILSVDYLQILADGIAQNENSRLIVYHIFHPGVELQLPALPFQYARVDLANYCVERKLAVEVGFPNDVQLHTKNPQHKDYIFFKNLLQKTANSVCYIDSKPLLLWNGNNQYKNLLTKLGSMNLLNTFYSIFRR